MPSTATPGAVRQVARKSIPVALVTIVAMLAVAWWQARLARHDDLRDLDAATLLAVGHLAPTVRTFLDGDDAVAPATFARRLDGAGALRGFAVYDATGTLRAASDSVRPLLAFRPGSARAPGDTLPVVTHVPHARLRFVSRTVAADDGRLLGTIVAVEDLDRLASRDLPRALRLAGALLVLLALALATVLGATWLRYDRRLRSLAEWLRALRTENRAEPAPRGLPIAELASEADRVAASLRAARTAGVAQSRAAVRSEGWDRDRLRDHALASLGTGQLVVASNREPYLDRRGDDGIETQVPAGGVVAALDPVLRACGGTWVAHGAGDADRDTADAMGRLTVPTDDPRYTLQRLWLSDDEIAGYYYGFANQGLWPLCHLTHERPTFRSDDWDHYRAVNARFADAILREVGDGDALVLLQDYHLALVPRLLKRQRPGLRVGLFWHIPWPHPDVFRTCPWRTELLHGMLGADLVGFHLQEFCNNFIDCAERMVESRIDRNHFTVASRGSSTHVAPFPISVKGRDERDPGTAAPDLLAALRDRGELDRVQLAVGVDRIDYTKGIPERLNAVRRLLTEHPDCRGRLTLVQLGAPSRTRIPRYAALVDELTRQAAAINADFATPDWQPVHLLVAHHAPAAVRAWLEAADLCLVTSLHDGMNLVAKEFVSAHHGAAGVLVLSEFTGAATELTDALIVNPYDARQTAAVIREAMAMPRAEREARMGRMARHVARHNVYRWAASLMTELAALEPSGRHDA